MANSQFDIDDDSPEIAYFPFVNLEPSSNVTAAWQLLYTISGAATSPGQVGDGTSYHYTSLDGASLFISWNGTGIDLTGTVNDALYNISLDGTPSAYFADPANSILASFHNLDNTNHSLLLTTVITNSTTPNAFLTFDKASITYAPPPALVNATATSQDIADSDIAFKGQWSYVTDSTGIPMHVSNSAGDNAQTVFQGSAITIYGLTSSYSGNFTVTLDNFTTALSARSSYNNSDSMLFYATGLSQDTVHYIAVTNQENRTLALRAGGMNTTSFGNSTTNPTNLSSSSSLSAGTIAAIVLAVVLFLVVIGGFYYACSVRRKRRTINSHAFFLGARPSEEEKRAADIERVASISPPCGEELESASLSTSKGYGFSLGLRRGFPFTSRKNKVGSASSEKSRNGRAELHQLTPPHDRDEKRLSIFTLTEDFAVLVDAPESEKLAPGWSYPVTRASHSLDYNRRHWKETQGIILPRLRVDAPAEDDNGDDADVKTLMSRQDEAIVATLSLSPRTSEALAVIDETSVPKLAEVDAQNNTRQLDDTRQPDYLQVRNISPFKIDVSTILGNHKGNRDSGRTTESGSSTWSKVRARLYRKAHRDDGRQSAYADKQDTSSSSSPESVPVVMHDSGFLNPPSEAAPGSGTYSFLDLTSSRVSLQRHSKTTLSSTPAELGHSAREPAAGSEDTSIRMVRIERSRDALAPKPDAPSTASGGSQPSDNSGTHTAAPTTHTQISSQFPFPITIPPSSHIAHTPGNVPERHTMSSPPHTPSSESAQYLQVPQISTPTLPLAPANSPTESVPFSVSEIHFRHSFSDHAGLDSQRASVASALPPHPPLPHLDGSQASAPTFSPPPPPYIVQRVLGLPMSPISPLSAVSLATSRVTQDNLSSAGRPGTSPTQTTHAFRVGSLLGPRPRPVTAGSVRGTAAPQLPMQGGRSNLRGPQ